MKFCAFLIAWISCVPLLFSVSLAAQLKGESWKASGKNGAIAAGSQEAVQAGLAILRRGGNAIDAAVAAQLTLTVTDSKDFCFGSEAAWLVFDARRQSVESVIGLGAAPRLATLEYFQQTGGIPEGGKPVTAAVPGAFDAMLTALDRYGTMTLAEVSRSMLQFLDQGTNQWNADLARTIRRILEAEAQSPHDRKRGLRLAADYFYRGPIAREIDAWSQKNGGLLRYSDLATHVTRIEEPLQGSFRGYSIFKCGPVTQGPLLLETLQLLESYNLKSMGHNSPDYIHTITEALKLAMADRDTYFADPLFEIVPTHQLLSSEYAAVRRPLIDSAQASAKQRPGDPWRQKPLLTASPKDYRTSNEPIEDTTTCVVADKWGNVVAVTPSGWGGVTAGETGVVLGSRLRSFNTWSGHPNCIAPGKRPRFTLTPTLVLKENKPIMAISVAGGDMQEQVTLQVLLNHIEFGLSGPEAASAPRFGTDHLIGSFNQTKPKLGSLTVDKRLHDTIIEHLKQKGQKTELSEKPIGEPVVLMVHPRTKKKDVAADPRISHYSGAF